MDIAGVVQRSREEQGLPPTIRDPGTLARIAELIALAGSTRKDTAVNTAVRPVMEAPDAPSRRRKAATSWQG